MSIEVHDPRMNAIFADGAAVEQLATGFDFTEGPVWHPTGRLLIFSDMWSTATRSPAGLPAF